MAEKCSGKSAAKAGKKESESNYQAFIRCLVDLLESEYDDKKIDKHNEEI